VRASRRGGADCGAASLVLAGQIRDENVAADMRRKRHADSDDDGGDVPKQQRKKLSTPKKDLGAAYDVAKVSTASLGRFDKCAVPVPARPRLRMLTRRQACGRRNAGRPGPRQAAAL
jgi:hypothetical protein